MNIIINILSKAGILILFYYSWQNIGRNSTVLNQKLVYFYLILVLLSLLIDKYFYKGQKSENNKQHIYLSTIISIAWFSGLIIPINEYSYFIRDNTLISIIGIGLVFVGIIIRGLSIKFLGKYFSRDIEKWKDHKLIQDGFYKYIRHPSYLGNILQIIGFPLILNSYYSLILSVVNIYLFIKRIKLEEEFLINNLNGYMEYREKTFKLIPFLW